MKLGTDAKLIVAGVIVVGAGVWFLQRQAKAAAGAAWSGLSGAAGDAWTSLAAGAQTPWVSNGAASAIEYAGLAVGIPRTNVSECDRLKAAGDWWGASFACPAGDFISSGVKNVFGSTSVRQAEQADARRVDNAIDYSNGDPFISPSGMDYRLF